MHSSADRKRQTGSGIQYIQEVGNRTGTPGAATWALTVTNAPSAGNLLVLSIANNNFSVSSVADSKGNTWQIDNQPSGSHIVIASTAQDVGTLLAADTITVTFSGSVGGKAALVCHEFSSTDTTASRVDATASNSVTASTNRDAGTTGTTSNANDLVFAAFNVNGVETNFTPGTGFTTPVTDFYANSSGVSIEFEYEIVAATGAFNPTATGGLSANSWGATVVYKSPGGTVVNPSFTSQTNWARSAPTSPAQATSLGWHLVPFTTKAGLDTAISSLQGNDYIYYNGTSGSPLIISSSSTNVYSIASKNPASTAVIDFGTMATTQTTAWGAPASNGNYVQFKYTGGSSGTASGGNCLQLANCSKLTLYGGEYTGGVNVWNGIDMLGNLNNITFLDFVVHDVGGNGFSMLPTNNGSTASMHDNTIRGEVYNWCLNPALDPHPDKGSGIHCAILFDTGVSGNFYNNTIAVYGHDSLQAGAVSNGQTWPEGGGGSCIEIGQSPNNAGVTASNNTLYAKAVNFYFKPLGTNPGSTQQQTGGNVYNLWGNQPLVGLVIGWTEGTNLTGSCRHGDASGNPGWWSGANIQVKHGRHTNVNLSTAGSNDSVPYPAHSGVTYTDCT